MGKSPGVPNRKRLFWLLIIIAVTFAALIGRVFYLMVIQSEELQQKALMQWTRDTALTASRGAILDTNGVVLAQSGTAYKVLIWPKQIDPDEQDRIAKELSALLDMDYASVLKKVTDPDKSEIVLKRSVEREVVDKIAALKFKGGVGTALDTKRYYPSGELFSQLLGFTTVDGVGQEGMEKTYDKYLAGTDGRMMGEKDGRGNSFAYGTEEIIEPENGCNIVLTTDSVAESYLEKALETALEVNNAESATGILMNCKTGEILAMSTQPDYDPNSPPRSDLEKLAFVTKNHAVTDAYEPGSTFKIITLSAAIDSGAVSEQTTFDCPGYYVVNGEKIRCWKTGGHQHQVLAQAVQNSCNPAFMRMALSMGKETFYDYIYAFGFGQSTGSGLIGESGGIVTHEKYIKDNTLARIGFGQSIAVTPLQLITAAGAAVNGGYLMQPYIVEQIISPDGQIIDENEPTLVRRVISESTSAKVREILESVVSEGSGKNGAVAGFRVGGKTGTAQKYEDGKIAEGKLIASFIGFAPADDPEFICLILVDEPKVGTIFGSTVAAPFVSDVLEETLRHYGYLPVNSAETAVVPDVTGKEVAEAKKELAASHFGSVYQTEGIVTAQVPAAGTKTLMGTEILLYTGDMTVDRQEEQTAEQVSVPDLSGKTRLEAYDALKAKGLEILIDPFDQTGTVIRQSPPSGTKVDAGTEILVEFSDTDIGE